MSSTLPPKKRPGAPGTLPPPDDFDEDAPTAVVPDRQPRVDMPREFDEGGLLDDHVDQVDEPGEDDLDGDEDNETTPPR